MTVFEAYITNLGKYAEGQLVGETLKFPATTEEVQSLLKNIGVDGVRYEEFFITAFDGDVMGLYDYLTEYENLDELNHLAHLISELDSDEIETLEAALNKGDHTSSVAVIINLVHNLDCYSLHPGVTDDETLGRIYVEDMELLDVPDNVLPYFDFEAYGRDMRINEGGHFAPTGYLTRSGDFKEVYHGIEDIPAEHRIFAYSERHNRKIVFAYLLLPGINDRPSDVRQLAKWFRGKKVMINVLQYNPTSNSRIKAPQKREIVAFKHQLEQAGLEVTMRVSHGREINAACGQLANTYNKFKKK